MIGTTFGIIGNASLKLGQHREARLYLEKALELDPCNQRISFTVSTAFHSEQLSDVEDSLLRDNGEMCIFYPRCAS